MYRGEQNIFCQDFISPASPFGESCWCAVYSASQNQRVRVTSCSASVTWGRLGNKYSKSLALSSYSRGTQEMSWFIPEKFIYEQLWLVNLDSTMGSGCFWNGHRDQSLVAKGCVRFPKPVMGPLEENCLGRNNIQEVFLERSCDLNKRCRCQNLG